MSINLNRKSLIFWALFVSMMLSFTITVISETHLSDNLSVASGILTGIALFITGMIILLDTITDICNP